jgi:hypothetical protein
MLLSLSPEQRCALYLKWEPYDVESWYTALARYTFPSVFLPLSAGMAFVVFALSLSATASSYMCNTAPHVSSYNTHLHCCILCLHTDVARCFLKNHRDLTPDDCMQFDGLSQEITRAIQSLYPNANGKKGKVCVVHVLCG